MNGEQDESPMTAKPPETPETRGAHDEMEHFAGGLIEAHHGYIPVWLLVVYLVLALWGLYYAYEYWGGLGPGRI